MASGHIPRTTIYSYARFGEYLCVGFDDGTPVDDTYEAPFHFNGRLDSVVVDVSGEPFRDLALELEAFLSSQ